jgi:hypothetical protein
MVSNNMKSNQVPADLSHRKINIGAGQGWYCENWEVLDNVPGDYSAWWKHRSKCWDIDLPANTYDTLFTSHMLEHVPHFRTEKTIAEFNRIMKVGGCLRILVPDLKRAAVAYVNGNKSFYEVSRHYTDHLGIGGSFMSKLISPGAQTLAISREMDEILGGYAHLYHFDFEMMRILLEKWGYEDVREMPYGESADPDMNENLLHLHQSDRNYPLEDPFVYAKGYLKNSEDWCLTGFDKAPAVSLIVEARKVRDEAYAFNKEYHYFRRSRFEGRLDKLKMSILRVTFRVVDAAYAVAKKLGLRALLRR